MDIGTTITITVSDPKTNKSKEVTANVLDSFFDGSLTNIFIEDADRNESFLVIDKDFNIVFKGNDNECEEFWFNEIIKRGKDFFISQANYFSKSSFGVSFSESVSDYLKVEEDENKDNVVEESSPQDWILNRFMKVS